MPKTNQQVYKDGPRPGNDDWMVVFVMSAGDFDELEILSFRYGQAPIPNEDDCVTVGDSVQFSEDVPASIAKSIKGNDHLVLVRHFDYERREIVIVLEFTE